jgi:uncharacterized alkaline shock family protein YloU
MDAEPKTGRITIAPEVLETTARLTTLAVPGVARLISPPGVPRLLGRQIQVEVTRAIRDMVGMEVESVDVYIEDVAHPSEEA